jgi:hypothetical protein
LDVMTLISVPIFFFPSIASPPLYKALLPVY